MLFYYSSVTENTARFVDQFKDGIDMEAHRIPITYRRGDMDEHELPVPDGPWILMVPSYTSPYARVRHVPVPVLKWLSDVGPVARRAVCGIVGMGNVNFGMDYAAAADELSVMLGTGVIARYELSGMPGDAQRFADLAARIINQQTLSTTALDAAN